MLVQRRYYYDQESDGSEKDFSGMQNGSCGLIPTHSRGGSSFMRSRSLFLCEADGR